jgi:hypothetical protein
VQNLHVFGFRLFVVASLKSPVGIGEVPRGFIGATWPKGHHQTKSYTPETARREIVHAGVAISEVQRMEQRRARAKHFLSLTDGALNSSRRKVKGYVRIAADVE